MASYGRGGGRERRFDRCVETCNRQYKRWIAMGRDEAVARAKLEECLAICEMGKVPKTGCVGGHRTGTVDGAQLAPCKEGFRNQKINGENWCCPEEVIDKDEEEKGCEGGYKSASTTCPEGYKRKFINGAFWCCPEKVEEEDKNGDGDGDGDGKPGPTPLGEEFTWSPGMQEAIRRLMERFEELLDRPYGLSDEERQAIINYYTTDIRRGERGRIQSMEDRLSRMGMAGSGLELRETGRIQRGTREMVSRTTQGLAIDEIDKALMNYLQTTGMAQGLLGTLMGAEVVPETLSAARRGEGLSQQQMVLNYLSTMYGGQSNAYWQAIMNYMGGQGGQQGPGMMDWLPYFIYGGMPGSVRTRD